jgi:hypothetical protein
MSPVLLILLSALLIAAAAVLKIHSRKAREKSGIPEGELIHADSMLMKVRKTLFSERLMLAGKPDAVIMRDGECIPVEIKIREPPSFTSSALVSFQRTNHLCPYFLRLPPTCPQPDIRSGAIGRLGHSGPFERVAQGR